MASAPHRVTPRKPALRPLGYHGPMKRRMLITPPKFRKRSGPYNKEKLAILAFDPGGTTGWSLLVLPRQVDGKDIFSFRPDIALQYNINWEHGELACTPDEHAAAYQMFKMCNGWPSAAIVVEDFILRAERKEKSRELLSPVRITAELEAHLWMTQRTVFKQMPSEAMSNMSDARLGMMGALVDDQMPDHARDADRHAVLFLKRCNGIKGRVLREQAWPWLYSSETGG